jgi:hypothetical protein
VPYARPHDQHGWMYDAAAKNPGSSYGLCLASYGVFGRARII